MNFSTPQRVRQGLTMYERDGKTAKNQTKSGGLAGRENSVVEFTTLVNQRKEAMPFQTASHNSEPKHRSLVARMVWWRDTFVRIAFGPEVLPGLPVSDLAERVMRSEKKKQQLQRRINELLNKK